MPSAKTASNPQPSTPPVQQPSLGDVQLFNLAEGWRNKAASHESSAKKIERVQKGLGILPKMGITKAHSAVKDTDPNPPPYSDPPPYHSGPKASHPGQDHLRKYVQEWEKQAETHHRMAAARIEQSSKVHRVMNKPWIPAAAGNKVDGWVSERMRKNADHHGREAFRLSELIAAGKARLPVGHGTVQTR